MSGEDTQLDIKPSWLNPTFEHLRAESERVFGLGYKIHLTVDDSMHEGGVYLCIQNSSHTPRAISLTFDNVNQTIASVYSVLLQLPSKE